MADKIEMIAGDMVHVSGQGAEPLAAGTPFTVASDEDAKRLEQAGHKRTAATRKAPATKAPKRRSKSAAG